MSTPGEYPTPGVPPQPPEPSTSARRGYTPTWWERRFPWLLDALASMDPTPLARLFAPLSRVLAAILDLLIRPLDRALSFIGRGLAALRAWAIALIGAIVRLLPLPRPVRRWLWIEPASSRDDVFDARAAWRRQYSVVVPVALMTAVGIHAAAFEFWPELSTSDLSSMSEELVSLELPPDVEIPPPPQQITRPAAPVIASADIDEDITIAPTTFDDYDVADLPPPPPEQTVDAERQPTFTPFTVAPRILNSDLIEELMAQEYPPLLRQAGIGGVVVVWAYIDQEGAVEETRVANSSGYETLDAAALRVAAAIEMSPALNRDVTVPVWIQLPLQFEVR